MENNETLTEPDSVSKTENAKPTEKKSAKEKRKKNGFVKFLLGILIFIAVVIVALLVWILYSEFDRAPEYNAIDKNYSALVHVESLYATANPLLDLKACDVLLSQKGFNDVRSIFMKVRSSPFRNNFFVKLALSRKLNAALYLDNPNEPAFYGIINLGFLSCATRLAPIALNFVDVPNLSKANVLDAENKKINYFKYEFVDEEKKSSTVFYIRIYKNLVMASNSEELFLKSCKEFKNNSYSSEEKNFISKKAKDSLRVIFNTKNLVQKFASDNPYAKEFSNLVKDGSCSALSLSINDYQVSLKSEIPLLAENTENPFAKILLNDSSVPSCISQFSDDVQYFTLLNFGSFDSLVDAVFPIMGKTQDINGLWKTANSLSSSLLGVTVEDLLFSWTTGECLVFGMEKSNSPVFALKIKDEDARRKVFDAALDSLILESNTSLIVNGIRLPCIQVPAFLNNLLNAFKINLPKPYYFVHNDFVYFSESAQNLCTIFNKSKDKNLLIKQESWKAVSDGMKESNAFSMYYNLERSIPFFLNSKNAASEILKLYNLGRLNLSCKNKQININLHAISYNLKSSDNVPGFPIEIDGRSNYKILKTKDKKSPVIYWLENEKNIVAFNTETLLKTEFKMDDKCQIVANTLDDKKNKTAELWALSKDGTVHLLDRELKETEGFPLVTGFIPSAEPVCYMDRLIVPLNDGSFLKINSSGEFEQAIISDDVKIKSAPGVFENYMAVYNKGFEGELYMFTKGACTNLSDPMIVDGIAYGSPAMGKIGQNIYTGFINQVGDFYLFAKNSLCQGFPVSLEGNFLMNAVFYDGSFFVMNDKALLYKINVDGTTSSIQLPDLNSAKEGILYANGSGKNSGIYVCADSNILFGFNSNLELLNGFPVAGRGVPYFTDINKDGITDCLVLSVDKKLHAWSLK